MDTLDARPTTKLDVRAVAPAIVPDLGDGPEVAAVTEATTVASGTDGTAGTPTHEGSVTEQGAPPTRPASLNEVARRLDSPTTGTPGVAGDLAAAEPVGGPDQ